MVTAIDPLRERLMDRRQRLKVAVGADHEATLLTRLLQEVDAALDRMDEGGYCFCEVCHEPVETDRLLANPLARFCLPHLTPNEVRGSELEGVASLDRHLRLETWNLKLETRNSKLETWNLKLETWNLKPIPAPGAIEAPPPLV